MTSTLKTGTVPTALYLAPRAVSVLGSSPDVAPHALTQSHAEEPQRHTEKPCPEDGHCGPGAVSARVPGRVPALRSPMGRTSTSGASSGRDEHSVRRSLVLSGPRMGLPKNGLPLPATRLPFDDLRTGLRPSGPTSDTTPVTAASVLCDKQSPLSTREIALRQDGASSLRSY